MKSVLATLTGLLLIIIIALAGGTHDHSHDEDGHASAAGEPGKVSSVTRTIEVKMMETDDGGMLFEPASIEIRHGETIRFAVVNTGEVDHEFVLDSYEKNKEHKKLMEKFPEMEHDDPNSVRLEPGESGEIIWKFSKAGTFEFACLIPGHYELGMTGPIKVAGH